jgi:hypothetical protein
MNWTCLKSLNHKKTIDEVAAIHSLELELLERWVEVEYQSNI